MYNLDYEKPAPLVPRRLRVEVQERIGPKGEVRTPLDDESVRVAVARLREEGVAAVAIALIHAYANPAHEKAVEAIVHELMPQHTYVCCSHQVLPEIREYERTSTTVVNALLGPIVSQYLSSLQERLERIDVRVPLQITQSNGGLMSVRSAIEVPARLLESGPAAGVIASAKVAQRCAVENVITLDMGGTTAKTAIIEDGVPARTTEYEVGAGINLSSRLLQGAGYAVKLPFIDVSEIRAGGGSVVWFDKGDLIQVGPQSAGSVPGPVCYGAGGTQVTLTDALVVLGYLNPCHLVGGALSLHADQATIALQEQVCTRLDRPLLESAHGIYTIAASNMMRAVKAVSTYRGRDPRDFTLFAFGGNGPIIALEIARELQMTSIMVPPTPGVFSALGLLVSDAEHETLRTLFGRGDAFAPGAIEAAYTQLEADVHAHLAQDGLDPDAMRISRFADLRYAGQAFELTVPFGLEEGDVSALESAVDAFHTEHERTYGHMSRGAPVELVNIRVISQAQASGADAFDPHRLLAEEEKVSVRPSKRVAFFGPKHGALPTPVIGRRELIDCTRQGPLIIEEYDATCIVPPGCTATLDGAANIEIRIEEFA